MRCAANGSEMIVYRERFARLESDGSIDPTLAGLLEGGFTAGVIDADAPGGTPWSYSVAGANLDFLLCNNKIKVCGKCF